MTAPHSNTNYSYSGPFERTTFLREYIERFSSNPHYSKDAIPSLLTLLGLIERDSRITDIRWAAYMLATVTWETTSLKKSLRPARNKKGEPLLDKQGKQIMLSVKKWQFTMDPVVEVGRGKGRDYHEPVKVKRLTDGTVRITEQDGDQFLVDAAGSIRPLRKGATMGSKSGGEVSNEYQNDDGTEQAYYGRGYVQLTWWSNYATSGVGIGKGLDLLLDPELVRDPEIAYAIMSHGMITGSGFANGRRLSDYFGPNETNYVGARAMVNGKDHAVDIAKIAEQFEAILMKSRTAFGSSREQPGDD